LPQKGRLQPLVASERWTPALHCDKKIDPGLSPPQKDRYCPFVASEGRLQPFVASKK